MQTTANYNLNKPENTDNVLVEKLNENMDIIDEALTLKKIVIADITAAEQEAGVTVNAQNLTGSVSFKYCNHVLCVQYDLHVVNTDEMGMMYINCDEAKLKALTKLDSFETFQMNRQVPIMFATVEGQWGAGLSIAKIQEEGDTTEKYRLGFTFRANTVMDGENFYDNITALI